MWSRPDRSDGHFPTEGPAGVASHRTSLSRSYAYGIPVAYPRGMNFRTLAAVANLLSVCRRLTRAQAGTVFTCERAGLAFLVTQNERLAGVLGHPATVELLGRVPLPWSERSIATHVALSGERLNIPDVYRIPPTEPYAFNPRVDLRTGFRTRSMLAVPLSAPLIGVLQLINATNEQGEVVPFPAAAEVMIEEAMATCGLISPALAS